MNRATKILIAGIFVNLCLGVLYSWSVFSKSLINDAGWSTADAGSPYAWAFMTFSACVLIAGYLQDRIGPQRLVIMGASLVGLGMIASSFASSPMLLNITFGLMVGGGIGLAYACLCPAAMKWFHASKKGMVNGLIVGAFGFAPVYMAPLATWMIGAFGLSTSFLVLGCGVLAIAVPLAFTIVNPPADYKAEVPAGYKGKAGAATSDMNWKQMLKTRQFYFLFAMFAMNSAAGAMLIGNLLKIIDIQADFTEMTINIIALLAVFNCAGRVGMGMLSDKIGCINTLLVAFALQSINMFMFPSLTTEIGFMVGAALAGIGYGAGLAIFPSLCTEYYGLKNYGTNYGVLYLAWGISAFIAKTVVEMAGSFSASFNIFLGMLIASAVIALITKPVKAAAEEAETELASA